MPIIVAQAVRYIIMAAVQLGIFSLLEKTALPLLNSAITAVMVAFGVPEEEAKDIVANELIQGAAAVGIFAATLQTKLPIKVAERLGFTTKGFSKRELSKTTALKVAGKSGVAVQSIRGVAKVGAFFERRLNTVFLGFLATSAFIDFGNWETGAYSKTFQDIFEKVTFGALKPDEDYRKTKTVSAEIFDKVYTAYRLEGAVEISDPYKNARVAFTRDNLIDLLDKVGAHLLVTQGNAKTADVIAATQLMIVFKSTQSPASQSKPATTQGTASSVKVFTGIVSQGTLGDGTSFTARPDDLIQSIDELNIAASHNLAAFISALPTRVVYEIKVVSSVTTKDGFTQRGESRQVQNGQYADGRPRYKTVINKFAVASLYILTDRDTRTGIGKIVLGPTDAIQFQPTSGELETLETKLRSTLITSDTSLVTTLKKAPDGVQTSANVNTSTPSRTYTKATTAQKARLFRAGASNGNPPPDQLYADTGKRIFQVPNLSAIGAGIYEERAVFEADHAKETHYETIKALLKSRYDIDYDSLPTRNPADLIQQALLAGYDSVTQFNPAVGNVQNPIYTVPSIEALLAEIPAGLDASPIGVGPVCAAKNLTEFFKARGEALPAIQNRQAAYEQFGLGSATYYTGTADQNMKLLDAYKRQAGCEVSLAT